MNTSTVDSKSFGRYTAQTAPQWAVGPANPELTIAHSRASGFFVPKSCTYLSMVGRTGEPKGSPGSIVTGFCSPVRLTTNEPANSGGELSKLTIEVASMATTLTQTQPEVTLVDGHAVTTSIAIADYFTKRHDDVLKKIRSLECSPEFNARNFAAVEYTDSKGEQRPAYQITRDGFAFLAMGFTGKRAAIFKENYITAFNRMEEALQLKYPRNCRVLHTYDANGGIVRSQISAYLHRTPLRQFSNTLKAFPWPHGKKPSNHFTMD
ncbi:MULTISPECIES: Rha family transcriptional regulator [unclassified Serratia (in: enterobacteria)]|uniref:Rha family phage regulatory protein n=1 Tax=unclassified Serratia (in: enterobacteria) TaxID=2647522 RepID=UPI003B42F869